MFIIYDIVFVFFAFFYLPYFLIKKRYREGLGMRLGILPTKIVEVLRNKNIIWIQAVSVGEVMAIKGIISALHTNFPSYKLLISTTTPTGNRVAHTIVKEIGHVIYFPLDLSLIIRRVVRRLNPHLVIIVETEIWPNLISSLYKRKIPVILLNGRISAHAFQGYRIVKIFLKKVLDKISLFCMQTETDALRIRSLGAKDENLVITGNMKFDIFPQEVRFQTPGLETFLGLVSAGQLFVAGSTHKGEEEIILRVYKEIQDEFPSLKLLLAPRHIDRAAEIEKLITKYGLTSIRASQIKTCSLRGESAQSEILLLDTIGELKSIYKQATVVFIGGSLVKRGGHNILEPAIWSKVVLFGPYMFNFRDIIRPFLDNNAAFKVKDKEELKQVLRTLLNNPREREEIGIKAKRIVEERRGATERNIRLIREILAKRKEQGVN
jgi:3-deoxy-D-manno-octulosonic-acid transferase